MGYTDATHRADHPDQVAAPDEADAPDHADDLSQALAGGGALLAGGALVLFIGQRLRRFRHRRSGRSITPTAPDLVPAEVTLRSTGSSGAAAATFLDQALRDLSSRLRRVGAALPDVAAVRLGEDRLDLLLTSPPDQGPPDPWTSVGRNRWTLPRNTPLTDMSDGPDRVDSMDRPGADDVLAPYPALVAVGTAPDGATWLLDLESAGLVQLTGDRATCENLARFMAADLAVNLWSDNVDITVAGFAAELVPMNPTRLRHHDVPDIAGLVKTARRVREAEHATDGDVLTGRQSGRGADSWAPTILVTSTDLTTPPLAEDLARDVERLLDEHAVHPGRHAVALVTLTDTPAPGSVTLTVDADQHCVLHRWNVTLTANQLTTRDARTLAKLLNANHLEPGDLTEDTGTHTGADPDEGDAGMPMPPAVGNAPLPGESMAGKPMAGEPMAGAANAYGLAAGGSFRVVSDAAGALSGDLTDQRAPGGSPQSLLPSPDVVYLDSAATTPADLAALGPVVTPETRERVLALDPNLDVDLAAWSDPLTPRPRLRVLGPIELRAAGERTADVDRRRGYFTELVAYLATREHGATPEQVAEAFSAQTTTIHSRITTVRKWLGTDPGTGDWYLPESTLSPASKRRGIPVYEVVGLLSDADLFRRLRVRGQARGSHGIDDLITALGLVTGPLFDQQRPGGYGWLAETPLDQYLTAGIVDVAHIIATHALAARKPDLARWASETAITVAPSEDKPRVDFAESLAATGHPGQAEEYLTTSVHNRTDDHLPPPPPSHRTSDILARRRDRPPDQSPYQPTDQSAGQAPND